jgi:hypothetical protein
MVELEKDKENRIYFATSKANSGCNFISGERTIHATATATASATGHTEHLAKKISEELAQIQAHKALKHYMHEYGISKSKMF